MQSFYENVDGNGYHYIKGNTSLIESIVWSHIHVVNKNIDLVEVEQGIVINKCWED